MVNRLKWALAAVVIACASAALVYLDIRRYPPGLDHAPRLDLVEGAGDLLTPAVAGPFDSDLEYTDTDLEMIDRIVQAFRAKAFAGALELSDQQVASGGLSAAYHSWSQAQLPVLLQAVAWQQMHVRAFAHAIVTLSRIIALEPSAKALKQLAICHVQEKHWSLAVDHFYSYLALRPHDVGTQLLLAQVLEQTGRYGEAANTLEQVQTTANTVAASAPYVVAADLDPHLLADREERLKVLKAASGDRSSEHYVLSDNFRLGYAEGVNAQPAPFILRVLEKSLEEYADNYDLPVPLSPIDVLLYAPETFQTSGRRGLFRLEKLYDGRLRLPIKPGEWQAKDFTDTEQLLRRELVHALLDLKNHSMAIPPWFDEGLAQHLACRGGKCEAFRFPPAEEDFMPPAAFLTPYLAMSEDNAARTFRQSRFLMMTLDASAGDGALRQVIRGISAKRGDGADDILAPVHLTLANLCAVASGYWGQRLLPKPRGR